MVPSEKCDWAFEGSGKVNISALLITQHGQEATKLGSGPRFKPPNLRDGRQVYYSSTLSYSVFFFNFENFAYEWFKSIDHI